MKNSLLFQLFSSESEITSFVATIESTDFQKSLPDGWTIGKNLQHILDIEQMVFESAQTINIELEISHKSDQIQHLMLVSERKFKAPTAFSPKKEISSISEFITAFKELRTKIYAYIENNSLDQMSEDSHPLFGSMSKIDWFIFLDTHTKRHIKQLKTILETYNQRYNATY